jgi:hypothetical protein
MKTRTLLSFVVSALLVFAARAAAEDVRGVIVKVDPEKKLLVLEGKSKGYKGVVLRLRVSEDTEIVVGRKSAKLADLATGKRARVLFETQGDEQVALRISMVSLASLLEAISGTPAPETVESVPPSATSVKGVLRRVSFTDHEIVVVSPGSAKNSEVETTFLVPDDARITHRQQSVRLTDLREGEAVAVEGENRDGRFVAKSIVVER